MQPGTEEWPMPHPLPCQSLAPYVLVPMWMHRLSSWVAIAGEIVFPVRIALRRIRAATPLLGVIFHVRALVTLEVGVFAIYWLIIYVVFVPWERLTDGADDHST